MEEKYLDDIKDPTLRTIIKTLENSPQEGIDNKKFYEYSNIGINNWISITETYSDALILLEYCLKNRGRYQIDAKTIKAVYKKVNEMSHQ